MDGTEAAAAGLGIATMADRAEDSEAQAQSSHQSTGQSQAHSRALAIVELGAPNILPDEGHAFSFSARAELDRGTVPAIAAASTCDMAGSDS